MGIINFKKQCSSLSLLPLWSVLSLPGETMATTVTVTAMDLITDMVMVSLTTVTVTDMATTVTDTTAMELTLREAGLPRTTTVTATELDTVTTLPRTKDGTLPPGPTSLSTARTTPSLTSSTTAPTTTADSTRIDVRLANSETTRRTEAIRLPSTTVTPDSPGTDGVMMTPTTTKLAAEMFVTKVLMPVTTTTRAGESRAARSGAAKKRVRSTMAMITVTQPPPA